MTPSQPAAAKIFVTGDPGCGKTTAVRRVAERLAHLPMTGFITEDVRDEGGRTGFRGVTLDGKVFTRARLGPAERFASAPTGGAASLEEVVSPPCATRPRRAWSSWTGGKD